jgi:hypothetical protein
MLASVGDEEVAARKLSGLLRLPRLPRLPTIFPTPPLAALGSFPGIEAFLIRQLPVQLSVALATLLAV